MEEYDIEPFMPGISPIGKATPAVKEFSVARPYIPDGTGYNMLRPRPGTDALKRKLEGLGRVSYVDKPDGGRHYRVDKLPANYLKDAKSPEQYSNKVQDFDDYLIKTSDKYGWYSPAKDTIFVKRDFQKPSVTRHEVAHALQNRKMSHPGRPSTYTVTGEELDARIVQHKGIRKGMKEWAKAAPYYTEYYKEKDFPGEGKAREAVARGMGKAAEAIPNKPGNFTGRLPTMRAVGGNLLDMFMVGPEMQKAKEDPMYGMGEEERARIEDAYEYGL